MRFSLETKLYFQVIVVELLIFQFAKILFLIREIEIKLGFEAVPDFVVYFLLFLVHARMRSIYMSFDRS